VALVLDLLAMAALSEKRTRRGAELALAATELLSESGAADFEKTFYAAHHDVMDLVEAAFSPDERAAMASAVSGIDVDAARTLVDSELSENRPAPPPPTTARTAEALTPREREIAQLVAQGLTNRQIAERLVIATRTAEGHLQRILTKLGLTSRTQLAVWVTEHLR
jgi:non-specific serine/threonine protein kinase